MPDTTPDGSSAESTELAYTRATFQEPPFTEYVTLIGQATLAWNDLHEHLGQLFGLLMVGGDRRWSGYAVWHSSMVDRAKREMFRALVESISQSQFGATPVREDILWLLSEAEKLEDRRNNVVHAPLHLVADRAEFSKIPKDEWREKARVAPMAWVGNKRAKRVVEKDLLLEYRTCRDTAIVLRNFAGDITDFFWPNPLALPRTWPERPRLTASGAPKKDQPSRL